MACRVRGISSSYRRSGSSPACRRSTSVAKRDKHGRPRALHPTAAPLGETTLEGGFMSPTLFARYTPRSPAVGTPEVLGQAAHRPLQVNRRIAGPHRVVLMGEGSAEEGHD